MTRTSELTAPVATATRAVHVDRRSIPTVLAVLLACAVAVAALAALASAPDEPAATGSAIAGDATDGWLPAITAAHRVGASADASRIVDGWAPALLRPALPEVDGWSSWLLRSEPRVVDGWATRYLVADE